METEQVAGGQAPGPGMGPGVDAVKAVKRFKFPVTREVSPGAVAYSMATTVNNTVLCT